MSPQPAPLWQIYKGIEPRYRILMGLGFMGFSMAGLWVSDKLEEAYPAAADTRVVHISHDEVARAEEYLRRNSKPNK
ncbi:hypothetical protein DL89DRAFT_269575 [Linderina pennispora]|uniref:Uncharacterized protein n=1 Tax=Linderina pennispora TaxID=61395 RepID=A0A1Y1W0W6_9FUNG|nr:uncharacterized protein DL89DRAFT_269575 [Linderina pennispora]ORX67147.1 hypothetical protein DL89DRAFT_269575 [Linderina pennispora]